MCCINSAGKQCAGRGDFEVMEERYGERYGEVWRAVLRGDVVELFV